MNSKKARDYKSGSYDAAKERRRVYLQNKYGHIHTRSEGAPDMWDDDTFDTYDAHDRELLAYEEKRHLHKESIKERIRQLDAEIAGMDEYRIRTAAIAAGRRPPLYIIGSAFYELVEAKEKLERELSRMEYE